MCCSTYTFLINDIAYCVITTGNLIAILLIYRPLVLVVTRTRAVRPTLHLAGVHGQQLFELVPLDYHLW